METLVVIKQAVTEARATSFTESLCFESELSSARRLRVQTSSEDNQGIAEEIAVPHSAMLIHMAASSLNLKLGVEQ